MQLHARAIGISGDEVPAVPMTWTSANSAVATISATGVLTGSGLGTTRITAAAAEGGKSSNITANVILPRLSSIDIAPAQANVLLGSVGAFSATGIDRRGRRYPAIHASWSTDDTSRLLLPRPDTGLVIAHALGQTTIHAAANDGLGALAVTIVPNPVTHINLAFGDLSGWDGDSLRMWSGDYTSGYAQPVNASGNIVLDRPVQWSSSKPAVATITNAGAIHAVAPGTFVITATIDGFSAFGPGRVRLTPPVVSVQLGTAYFTRVVGQELKMHATVLGLGDSVMPNRPVTWTSSNPVVARITDDAVLTAVSPGTTQVIASSGGKSSDPLLLTVVANAPTSQWNPLIRFDGPEYAPPCGAPSCG